MNEGGVPLSPWRLLFERLGIALAGVLAFFWALEIPFLLDDYTQVPMGFENFLPIEPRSPEAYLFRPTLWILFEALRWIDGVPLDYRIFHGAAILLQILVAWCIHGLLHRLGMRRGALFAGLAAASFMIGSEAILWISAWGDVLATLFFLVAALLKLRPNCTSGLRLSLAGFAIGGAFLAKDSTIVFAPVFGVLLIGRMWQDLRWRGLTRILLWALPIGLAICWRAYWVGTFQLRYAMGASMPLHRVVEAKDHVAAAFAALVNPLYLKTEWSETLSALCGASVGILLVCAAWPRMRGGRIPLLILLALSFAPYVVSRIVTEYGADRVMYPFRALLCILVGAAIESLCRSPSRVSRIVAGTALILVCGLQVRLHILGREEWEIPKMAAITRIEGAKAAIGDDLKEHRIVVIDEEAVPTNLPVLGEFLSLALRPPFHAESIDVLHFLDRKEVLKDPGLIFTPRPIAIIEYRQGEWSQIGATLAPAPVGMLPNITWDETSRRYRVEPPVATRYVLSLLLTPSADAAGSARVRLHTDSNVFERALSLERAANSDSIALSWDLDWPWLLAGRLQAIEVQLSEGTLLSPPEFALEPPRIEVLGPAQEARYRPSETPTFELAAVPAGALLRFEFHLPQLNDALGMAYEIAPGGIGFDAVSKVTWTPKPQELVASIVPGFGWHNFPAHYERNFGQRGIGLLFLRWRVSALDAKTRQLLARSLWQPLQIAP